MYFCQKKKKVFDKYRAQNFFLIWIQYFKKHYRICHPLDLAVLSSYPVRSLGNSPIIIRYWVFYFVTFLSKIGFSRKRFEFFLLFWRDFLSKKKTVRKYIKSRIFFFDLIEVFQAALSNFPYHRFCHPRELPA